MADIAELLERVGAATGPDREIDYALFVALAEGLYWPDRANLWEEQEARRIPRQFTASLDAALALARRVLPAPYVELSGPRRYLHIPTPVPNYWRSELGSERGGGIGWGATAPLALLAALLCALPIPPAQGDVGNSQPTRDA